MISVDEARAIISNTVRRIGTVEIPLSEAAGCVLAEPVVANLTHPPFAASAMDGYAIRYDDIRQGVFKIIGISSAGDRFSGAVKSGEAVRIYTGAPIPDDADTIIIQEHADRDGDHIQISQSAATSANQFQHVRREGIDFFEGGELLAKGTILNGPALALAAAGNNPTVSTYQKPRIGVIANGDELVMPGDTPGKDDIICSIPAGLLPMLDDWGADSHFLGVIPDDLSEIRRLIETSSDYDILIPLGGASVGDRDFMRRAFSDCGFVAKFEKVAVKPGKPTWFGTMGDQIVLGLPGNPASALVTAILFARVAVNAALGQDDDDRLFATTLTEALAKNGPRETWLRGTATLNEQSQWRVSPNAQQDSSLLSVFAKSNVLIRREANAPPLPSGAAVQCLQY